MDRETLADILTNEEPDSYVHGERTFRDWMLEYADRVLEKYEEHDGLSTLTFAWREGYEAGRRDKSEIRTIVNPYVDGV